MKAIARKQADDVDARARDWLLLLLDNDLREADLIAWGAWLDADSRHRAAYERAAATWELMGSVHAPRPSHAELAEDSYDPSVPVAEWRRRRKVDLRLVWVAAGAIAVVAGLGFSASLYLTRQAPFTSTLVTARAQHLEARLADGSEVRLGAMTNLKVSMNARRRSIDMGSGEALFQVAHNPTIPFVVTTSLGAITAVGTGFNVDVGAQTLTLRVTEGAVSVSPAFSEPPGSANQEGAPLLRIAAGQRLRIERSGSRLMILQDATAPAPAWADGRLEYINEPLRLVIEDVNRYAARPIVVATPDLGELAFTGSVQVDATDAWARGLEAAFPVKVQLNSHQQLVLSRRSGAGLP